MRRACPVVVTAVALAALLVGPGARADDTIDFRSPVRLGLGFSGPYGSPMTSFSYHDQFRIVQISEVVGFEVLAGIDSVGILSTKLAPSDGTIVGYSAAEVGAGLSIRSPKGGALFVASGALGPIFDSNATDTRLAGFGFSTRVEIYPLYLTVKEAIECEKGPAYTYVASGISVWTGLRGDIVEGAVAPSWSIGFGLDMTRSLLLPIIGGVLKGACSKKHYKGASD